MNVYFAFLISFVGLALIVLCVRDGFRIAKRLVTFGMEQRAAKRKEQAGSWGGLQAARRFKGKITLSVFLIVMGWGMLEYRKARDGTAPSRASFLSWRGDDRTSPDEARRPIPMPTSTSKLAEAAADRASAREADYDLRRRVIGGISKGVDVGQGSNGMDGKIEALRKLDAVRKLEGARKLDAVLERVRRNRAAGRTSAPVFVSGAKTFDPTAPVAVPAENQDFKAGILGIFGLENGLLGSAIPLQTDKFSPEPIDAPISGRTLEIWGIAFIISGFAFGAWTIAGRFEAGSQNLGEPSD